MSKYSVGVELQDQSALGRRKLSMRKPTRADVLLRHNEDDGDKSSRPTPSFLGKVASITPLVEWLGFLKDHRMCFKESWIEANHRPQDGARLKEGITFMFEMELIFGSLIMAVNASIFYAIEDASLVADFTAGRVGTPGFWINFLGAISLQTSVIFVILVYICLVSLQPVSAQNFYLFLRNPSVQQFLAIPNLLLVSFLYLFVAFVCLTLAYKTGGSWLSICVCFVPAFAAVLCMFPWVLYHLNLAHSSGVFAPVRLVPTEKQLELTDKEIERLLYWRAVEHRDLAHDDPRQYYADIFAKHAVEEKKKEEKYINADPNVIVEGTETGSGNEADEGDDEGDKDDEDQTIVKRVGRGAVRKVAAIASVVG